MTHSLNDAAQIQAWCTDYIARTLGMPRSKIDPALEVDRLGLDSATAVALIMDLEAELGIELAPELLFEHPTLARLSAHLAAQLKTKAVA